MKLRAPWSAGPSAVKHAESDAAKVKQSGDDFYLPALGATEGDPDMHLLWQHCMRFQIEPRALRRMDKSSLEYLAAHSGEAYFTTQQGELLRGQIEKLRANAVRARFELERRHRRNAATLTTLIAAAVGGGAGGIVVWLLGSQ